MKPDPFDAIARLIETEGAPFPAVHVRRLIFRATSRTTVTPELAKAISQLHISIAMLSEIVALNGANAWPKRQDALDDLARLRDICRRAARIE